MPKLTKYKIKISPTEIREIEIRRRSKPRKLRLSQVQKFNQMIEQGIIAGPQFNEKGRLVGLSKIPDKLSNEQIDIIRRVVDLSFNRHFEKKSMLSRDYEIAKKWGRFLSTHGRRGGFEYLHPTLEMRILKGENPHAIISYAEALNQELLPGLREVVSRLNTPEKVTKNLKIQLAYFRQLLKEKGVKEMVISEEISRWDSMITKIKLTGRGVERETIAHILRPPFGAYKTLVLLSNNGKISVSDVLVE